LRPKREEYAKRFEELTKQQIKNYNDSVANIHTALEDCRENINNVSLFSDKKMADVCSRLQALESQNIDLQNHVSILTEKLNHQESQFFHSKQEKVRIDNKVDRLIDGMHASFISHYDYLNEKINEIIDSCCRTNEKTEEVHQKLDRLYLKTKVDNENLKKEIQSSPNPLEDVCKDIEKRISIKEVNTDGLLREIKVFRADFQYIEKNIENIYTLIKRLQKLSTGKE